MMWSSMSCVVMWPIFLLKFVMYSFYANKVMNNFSSYSEKYSDMIQQCRVILIRKKPRVLNIESLTTTLFIWVIRQDGFSEANLDLPLHGIKDEC